MRVINLGDVNPMMAPTIWEISRKIDYKEPILFTAFFNQDTLGIFNNMKFNDFFNYIPENIKIWRAYKTYEENEKANKSPFYFSKDTLFLILIHPTKSLNELIKIFPLCFAKILRKRGINALANGNDIMINNKKMGGSITQKYDKCQAGGLFALTQNYEILNSIFHIDFKPNAIGLDEVNIGKEILNDVVIEIANYLNEELEESSLTNKEETALNDLFSKLNTKEWLEDAIHPE